MNNSIIDKGDLTAVYTSNYNKKCKPTGEIVLYVKTEYEGLVYYDKTILDDLRDSAELPEELRQQDVKAIVKNLAPYVKRRWVKARQAETDSENGIDSEDVEWARRNTEGFEKLLNLLQQELK